MGPESVASRRRRKLYRWTVVAAVATVAGAVIALVAWLDQPGTQPAEQVDQSENNSISNEGSNSGVICSGDADCRQEVPPTTAQQRTPRPIGSAIGCPMPDSTVPARREVTICVLYWCKGDVYSVAGEYQPDQYQLKIRPLITNYSGESVNIAIESPSRIRLLVAGAQIDQRWSPQPGTLEHGDRPQLVSVDGADYWAIPPNRPRTEASTSAGVYTGFASTWSGPSLLAPNSTAGQVAREPRGENLVFQVPLDQLEAADAVANVLGLALIDYASDGSPTVVSIDYADEWPTPDHPTSF